MSYTSVLDNLALSPFFSPMNSNGYTHGLATLDLLCGAREMIPFVCTYYFIQAWSLIWRKSRLRRNTLDGTMWTKGKSFRFIEDDGPGKRCR